MAKAPEIKIKRFPLEVAVWANESSDGRTYYTTRLSRSWKDESTGEYKNTDALFTSDLPAAALLLEDAYREIVKRESEDRATSKRGGPEREAPAPAPRSRGGDVPF